MKVQNKSVWKMIRQSAFFAVLFCMVLMLIQQTSLSAYAMGKAKVVADSGKVRAAAGTDSEVKASVTKGSELDIIAQKKDASGYIWYKVYVNDTDTGYIRADLLSEATGTIPTEEEQSDSTTTDNTEQQAEVSQVNDSTAAAGKVTGDNVNIRENPSTNAAVVAKANGGAEVTISGETTDNAGKIWYQVSYNNKTGFIRFDFLEITQTVEPEVEETVEPEEEEPVEPVVQEPVNQDYELVYEANMEGVEEWFLYDYNRGTKQSLENLLTIVRQSQEEERNAVSQLKTFKIIAIVLAAVILVLVVVVTILIFKLRDSYEYEYDDDEEDEEDDDEDIEEDEDDDDEMVRRPVFKKTAPVKTVASREMEERQVVKTTSSAAPEKKDTSWQSKNFLDIDDDMEFEFLDLK